MSVSTSESADSDETSLDGAGWVIFTSGTPELLPMRTPVSEPLCNIDYRKSGLEDLAPGPQREVCSGDRIGATA
jgi:hypothetical protein